MVLILDKPPRKPPPTEPVKESELTTSFLDQHETISVQPGHIRDLTRLQSFLWKYSLSFVAASCAEFGKLTVMALYDEFFLTIIFLVTYPLDLTKTRLQIQGELASEKFNHAVKHGPRKGMVRIALGIIKEEGTLKLWQGITPALWRHTVYSGVRMTFYESLREDVFGKNVDGTIPLWKSIIAGVTAGSVAQFLSSPADLVKIQIQMEGKRRLMGQPPRVHGAVHALQTVMKQGGVRGLWAGCVPNVQRAAFVNLGDLTTYDTAKHLILANTRLSDNYFTHILSR